MVPRQFDTDVVVVGGGPAGSATAIACAERGLPVRLFERDMFTGDRPGETFHPGIEPVLGQLGVGDRLSAVIGARHEGTWIEWGGGRRFEGFGSDASGPWRGFQVSRAGFDTMLLARARELGVAVQQPCAVREVLLDGDRVAGVVTRDWSVSTRLLVDASGRSHWLARALGVARARCSPRLVARYGYAGGSCPARDDAPALVGDASGWLWTAMVRPGVYQWTRVVPDGSRLAAEWLPEEFRALTPLGRPRGADVTWRIANQVARAGWFMVGDAAAVLDPTSSHGALKALMSGITAGHLIAAVLHRNASAMAAADAYRDWLVRWFARDVAALSRFYRELGIQGFAEDNPAARIAPRPPKPID